MLPHYSPFKVAETFSLLAGLHPGRIDLGLGRAPGTDPLTTLALQRDRRKPAPDDFPQQLAELLALLEDAMPPSTPSRGCRALPGLPERPEPWLLGSSPQSAIWAAELGLPYSFADFINPAARRSPPTTARFADPAARGAPSGRGVGDVRRDRRGGRAAGRRSRMAVAAAPGPADRGPAGGEGAALPGDCGAPPSGRPLGVIGSPATVRAGLEEVAAEYGAEEVMVVTITHDHGARGAPTS